MKNRNRWLRAQGWTFNLLLLALLALLAWATADLKQSWQWGGSLHTTLSEPSRRLLALLDRDVQAYGFAQPGQLLHRHLSELLGLYQAETPRFRASIVNPDTRPDLVREYGVEQIGTVVLELDGRRELVPVPAEAHISAALERLLRSQDQFIAFLSGHGERNLLGEANHDLGAFGQALQRKGYRLQPLNLLRAEAIPDNTALLVVTPPQVPLLPGERAVLLRYLEDGGNLLWLADPGEEGELAFLAEAIGLRWRPGVVVDPQAAAALGIDDSRLVLIDDFPEHVITASLRAPALLVQSGALEPPAAGWEVAPLLPLSPQHGLVQDYPDGAATTAAGALAGVALSRSVDGRRQRLAVFGDGDFLSNSYLGNGANLALGLNLVDWLTQSEAFLDSYARPVPDQVLELGYWQVVTLAVGLLLALPLGFLVMAGTRWWRRRRG
ncbi:MAG: hypothetical protein GX093_12920 [Xanthomonadaceae bacterium]|nr:hypothetical protein [Xanthomonadaceae bacterium]